MKPSRSKLFELHLDLLSETDRILVVGDLHGDYQSYRRIRTLFDPRRDYAIFLGDYADRGSEGIEVIDGVRKLLREHPDRVIALKGNHEDYARSGQPTFYPCNLIEETERKRGGWQRYFSSTFQPFVEDLFLAVIIPNEILFVHGGVSRKVYGLDDLRHPTEEVEKDVLWSDPFEGTGERPNRRGRGIEFGNDVTSEVCRRLGVKKLIRSHEPRKAFRGPYYEHDRRVITTSTTSVYGGIPFVLTINPTTFVELSCYLEEVWS